MIEGTKLGQLARKGSVAVIGALLAFAISLVWFSYQQAQAALPPAVTIAKPVNEVTEVDTGTRYMMRGTASAQDKINRVSVAIKNLDTKLWLQPAGAPSKWDETRDVRDAEVYDRSMSGGRQSAKWRWEAPVLPNGYYQVEVQAFDDAGNRNEPAEKSRFYVNAPGPGDTQRPTGGVITTPSHATSGTYTVSVGSRLSAEGIARDTSNDSLASPEVTNVYIAVKVRNTSPTQWLQNDTGTPVFGTSRKVFTATLDEAYMEGDALKQAWSWQSPVLPAGTYSLEAQAEAPSGYREGAGLSNPYLCRTNETCTAYPYSWFNVTTGTTGDTTSPAQGIVTNPKPSSSYAIDTPLTVTGTAKDTSNDSLVPASIQKVMVAVKNTSTNQWLQTASPVTWSATRVAFQATLVGGPITSNGVVSQGWSFPLSNGLPFGAYRLEVQPFDNNGNKQIPVQQVGFPIGQNDSILPFEGAITAPLPYASWGATTPQNITGNVKDKTDGDGSSPTASNISRVKVTIKDADTELYRQLDGSFAAQRVVHEGVLGNFSYNATTQTWTQQWSFTPSPALPTGEYIISAWGVDLAGNVETDAPLTRVAVGATSGTAYLTIDLGRAQWQQFADGTCTTPVSSPTGSIMTLDEVATALYSRATPISAVGNVTPNRTLESGVRKCISGISYPTWADLALLKNQKAWKFVSTGQAYTELDSTTFPYLDPDSGTTVASLDAEICGSLDAFTSHNHLSAHGMFAYPNNRFPAGTENPAKSCFDFGRKYQYGFNIKAKAADPWWAKTSSINGGICNNAALPCNDASGVPGASPTIKRYVDPALVGRLMSPRIGTWSVVQFYRFVEGSKTTGGGPNWDCTSSDWRNHWTSQTEVYCWNDFQTALNSIPTWVQIKDPATVGNNWGR